MLEKPRRVIRGRNMRLFDRRVEQEGGAVKAAQFLGVSVPFISLVRYGKRVPGRDRAVQIAAVWPEILVERWGQGK